MSVTIAQVRNFLRYDNEDSDDALTIMLAAAQDWVERHTGHLLTEREVVEQVTFGPVLNLRWEPYSADTLAVTYLDRSFASQTLEGFIVRGDGRVLPTSGWPASKGATLTYTAGYADPAQVPASMIHAMCLYCAMSDDDRGDITASSWTALRNVLGDYWRPVIA